MNSNFDEKQRDSHFVVVYNFIIIGFISLLTIVNWLAGSYVFASLLTILFFLALVFLYRSLENKKNMSVAREFEKLDQNY